MSSFVDPKVWVLILNSLHIFSNLLEIIAVVIWRERIEVAVRFYQNMLVPLLLLKLLSTFNEYP